MKIDWRQLHGAARIIWVAHTPHGWLSLYQRGGTWAVVLNAGSEGERVLAEGHPTADTAWATEAYQGWMEGGADG